MLFAAHARRFVGERERRKLPARLLVRGFVCPLVRVLGTWICRVPGYVRLHRGILAKALDFDLKN
jgi:hypothetical protein